MIQGTSVVPRCHVWRSRRRSCGRMNVFGRKPKLSQRKQKSHWFHPNCSFRSVTHSWLPHLASIFCRLRHSRSLRPIWNVPGKWLTFWCGRTSRKSNDFMCLPHVPTHSLGSLIIRKPGRDRQTKKKEDVSKNHRSSASLASKSVLTGIGDRFPDAERCDAAQFPLEVAPDGPRKFHDWNTHTQKIRTVISFSCSSSWLATERSSFEEWVSTEQRNWRRHYRY